MGLEEDGRSPKFFDVRLNYSGVQSFGYLVIVLCHELIHVSQYAKNRLRYFQRDNRIAFCNEKYDWDKLEYDDRPWEIEAHKIEGEVFYYVLDKAPEIQEYLEAKSCDSWRPELTL